MEIAQTDIGVRMFDNENRFVIDVNRLIFEGISINFHEYKMYPDSLNNITYLISQESEIYEPFLKLLRENESLEIISEGNDLGLSNIFLLFKNKEGIVLHLTCRTNDDSNYSKVLISDHYSVNGTANLLAFANLMEDLKKIADPDFEKLAAQYFKSKKLLR